MVIANVRALVAMIVVNAAAFRLARRGWPGEGMRLPGGVLLPILATLACVIQFVSLQVSGTVIALAAMLAGLCSSSSATSRAMGVESPRT